LDQAAAGEGRILVGNLQAVTPPPVADGAVQAYHQYRIRVPADRDGLAKALRQEYNIGSACPIRARTTSSPPSGLTSTRRRLPRLQPSACPARPPVAEAGRPERIVTAVNALAKAGA
jgi:hypothetical protein